MSAWIANLPLRRKLLLLCLFGLMMMAAPATMVLRSSVQELRAIQSERTGMPPSRALLEVVRLMQEHRGLSNAFLSGDATRLPMMKERQGLLDAALSQAQTTVDELGDAATSDMVKDIRTAWAALYPPVHQQAVAAANASLYGRTATDDATAGAGTVTPATAKARDITASMVSMTSSSAATVMTVLLPVSTCIPRPAECQR